MTIKSGLLAPISWKTVNSNDWNQVFNQRFSFKQCFAAGANSCRLRKSWFCPLLFPIDLLSLCILFSHFKPRDALMGISLLCFFNSHAYICTCIRRHLKETIPSSSITWSEMRRQNIQAKEVYLFVFSHTEMP